MNMSEVSHLFRRKPLACGIPTIESDIGRASGILLNTARGGGGVTQTPYDGINGWVWRDRLAIDTGGSSVVFIDEAGTPYLLSVSVIRQNTYGVRTTVRVVSEFGCFGKGEQDFNHVILDEDITFSQLPDNSYSGVVANVPSVIEQSPSGAEVLVNVPGIFVVGSALKEGVRKLAGVVKLNISGTADEFGNGISCSQSIYKDVNDSSPSSTGMLSIQKQQLFHYEVETTVSHHHNESAGGADPILRKIYYQEEKTVNAVLGLSSTGVEDEYSFRTGVEINRDSQNIIMHTHFDDGGNIVELGVNLREEQVWDYDDTFVFSFDEFIWGTVEGAIQPDGAGGENVLCYPDARVQTHNKYRKLIRDYYRSYTMALTINGIDVSAKSYVHRQLRDDEAGVLSGAAPITDGYSDQVIVAFTDPYNESSAGWPATGWWDSGISTEDYKFGYISELPPYTSSTVYSATDWDEIVNTSIANDIINQEFGDMDVTLVNNRWVYLGNGRSGEKTPAYSAYGETPAIHSEELYYNHHTGVITDIGAA